MGNGRKVEQYAHRLGAVVSQFIVDSLGCPFGRGRKLIAGRKLIGELAAGLHLQSTIAFMTLLMSRGRAERGREKDRGRV